MTSHDEEITAAAANITHRCSGMSFKTLEQFLDSVEQEITTGRAAAGLNAFHAVQALAALPDGSKLQVLNQVRKTLLSLGRFRGNRPEQLPPPPEPVRGPSITIHAIRTIGWARRDA